MKQRSWIILIIVLLLIIILVLLIVFWCKIFKDSKRCQIECDPLKSGFTKDGNPDPKCIISTGTGTGTNINTGTGTPVVLPEGGITCNSIPSCKGKTLRAVKNNTQLYYNGFSLWGEVPLEVAKIFNAGDIIGELGNEATGYITCPKRPGYYEINNTGISSYCGVVMNGLDVAEIILGE